MFLQRFVLSLSFLLLVLPNVNAGSSDHNHTRKTLPPGHVLTKDGCIYKISFDKEENRIKVVAKGLKDPKPTTMTATMKMKSGPPKKVKLKLLESHEGVDIFQSSPLIHEQSSFQFGVSFDINFGPQKLKKK